MRVSLQIDGDASGAVKAATEASDAVENIGKHSETISDKVVDAFEKAAGAIGKIKGMNEAAGAANDNVASTIANVAQKVAELATRTLGSESAFAKATAGTTSFVAGLGAVIRAASPLGLISGAIGLATSAISTFYALASDGAQKSQHDLDEQQRLIGVVRDAYKDASRAAGDFFNQSKAVTQLQLTQSTIALRSDLQKNTGGAVRGFYQDYAVAGLSQINNPFSDGSETRNIEAMKGAVDGLNAAVASGSTDVRTYLDQIAALGNAAAATNPKLAKAANDVVAAFSAAANDQNKIAQNEAALAQLNGTATETQKRMLGISDATQSAGANFERLLKSVDRQSASLEAETAAVGGSAGAMAQLRAQTVLTEAAHQAGAGVADKYADSIARIAARAGEANQKLAVAKIQTDASFQLSQLGRNSIDQSVAAQLQGAFGNNADLSGSTAQLVRFTETMKDLKATTLDVTQGAWRTFLSSVQQGSGYFKALGDAGVDALNRIIAKAGDRALDNLVSAFFGGSSLSSGGIFGNIFGSSSGGVASTISVGSQVFPAFGAAAGGTFGPGWGVVGEKGAEIIRVFNGGVTVYPHEVSKPYLPGFADGGTLSSLGNVTRLPRGRQDSAPQVVMQDNRVISIGAGASQETVAQLKAALEEDRKQRYSETVQIVRDAQSRGTLAS